MTLLSRSSIWKTLCLDNLERANGSPTLNYTSPPHGNAGPQTQWCSHGEAQPTSPFRSFSRQRSFPFHVFDPPAAFYARSGRSWHLQNGCSHGEGCRCPVGCSKGHDPTVAAASPQRSRSPALNSGKRGDKQSGNNRSKSCPPYRPDFFFPFKTLAMACVNLTITTPIRLIGVLHLYLVGNLACRWTTFGFFSQPNTCYYHGHSLPCQHWIDFLNGRIDKWQVFGWYWSNIEHCSLQPKFQPIWSTSQRGRWATYPLLGLQ